MTHTITLQYGELLTAALERLAELNRIPESLQGKDLGVTLLHHGDGTVTLTITVKGPLEQ